MRFSAEVLILDAPREVERIASTVRRQVFEILRRKGAVLGLSGGVDSAVTAGLLARALGAERVLGLTMPEAESEEESTGLARRVAATIGISCEMEDITGTLEALGCYARRDAAIRQVVPGFGPGWKCKIVLPELTARETYRVFSVVAQSPDGQMSKARLTPEAYLGTVAATSFKQRVRKMLEYYHADRLNFAVAGTPNRLEYDQGFFVKNGDGAADLKPIAHLYKTQVYQLAAYLGLPAEITSRPPTTDTYSLAQSQDEFYFSVPYRELDLCLYALDHGVAAADVAPVCGLATEQVERVFRDIEAKRSATRYQHLAPLLVEG